jgi:hypothetical protein
VANFLIRDKGMVDAKLNAPIPTSDQISCFLMKKNLSPIVLLASVIEEMEINIRPIVSSIETKKMNLDDFIDYLT